jgi:hypothetical protein
MIKIIVMTEQEKLMKFDAGWRLVPESGRS